VETGVAVKLTGLDPEAVREIRDRAVAYLAARREELFADRPVTDPAVSIAYIQRRQRHLNGG
jgi:hypothetical protein|tara:strand:+ start:791 stop:976 length:186 start_codon:yes stop_codon:yes gene_type:complete